MNMKIAGAVFATLMCSAAQATDFSFTGSFTQDDNVQLFNFTVGSSSSVTLRSLSYAGGTNAQAQTIASGGFDPILALFNGTGALINQNDDGGSNVPADAVTGARYDVYLQSLLAPGDYTVSVAQYNNFAVGPNLSNGFGRTGTGNFTPSLSNCGATQFCDVTGSSPGNRRDGHWAFDILNVSAASVPNPTVGAVPEPGIYAMMLAGLGFIGFARRRQRPKA